MSRQFQVQGSSIISSLESLKAHWQNDLLAGFFVFLVALPLCLAIAMASGFPPSAGIITAIVGGLLVSRINGSFVTINGPAAGLIVVVYSAVQGLGQGDAMAGYRYTLAAIVVAGAFQVLMGLYKGGRFSAFFPASVAHGMLAAIGLIIIAKQSHIMLGVTPESGSILSMIAQIPYSLTHPKDEIAYIGLSGLAVLIFWPLLEHPMLKRIPAPLMVLLVGMGLGQFYGLQHEHLHLIMTDHVHLIGPEFLVQIPDDFAASFFFPDFSKWMTTEFWSAVISICLVGSLESLLSAAAIDKLDPEQRKSDLDKDLAAVGAGNMLSGLIGGLPMIAEIVRSSANINSGAKTGWANFFHGLILLAFVALFPHLIHNIPQASLAVLLVYTGYKLASPKSFKQVLEVGVEQLGLFVITIIGVLATNLLMGVVIGIIVKLAIHIVRGVWLTNLFKIYFSIQHKNDDLIVVKLLGSAMFSNFLPLKQALETVEKGKTLVFNFTDGYLIDHTVMDFIHDFSEDYIAQGGRCYQVGHPLEHFSDHKLAARLMTKDDRKT